MVRASGKHAIAAKAGTLPGRTVARIPLPAALRAMPSPEANAAPGSTLTGISVVGILSPFGEVECVQVRVSDVRKWAGREERFDLEEPWPALLHERLDAFPEDPARLSVRVRNVGDGLIAEVTGHAVIPVLCARCLAETRVDVPFAVSEEFREEPGPQMEDLDYLRYTGDHLDLDALVADAVALEIPLAPLCKEDCKGLCPRCGTNWNVGSCRCAPAADPRWDALRDWAPDR